MPSADFPGKVVVAIEDKGRAVDCQGFTGELDGRSANGFASHRARFGTGRILSAAAPPSMIDRHAPDLAIVDLDCLEPELWRWAARLRATFPKTPVVILGHAWPTPARLDPLQPCTYVRKPFAIDALLDAVQDVPTTVCRSR